MNEQEGYFCPRCRQELFSALIVFSLTLKANSKQMAIQITDDNFKDTVINSDKPVLLDFWAEWCGPCRMIGPVVEELSKQYEGQALIGKVNVDENPETAIQYGIRSIPTLLIFKNGQVVDKQVGVVPKSVLENKLKAQLA
jgi:thioredoxin 1